jgi:hypothetical protein
MDIWSLVRGHYGTDLYSEKEFIAVLVGGRELAARAPAVLEREAAREVLDGLGLLEVDDVAVRVGDAHEIRPLVEAVQLERGILGNRPAGVEDVVGVEPLFRERDSGRSSVIN